MLVAKVQTLHRVLPPFELPETVDHVKEWRSLDKTAETMIQNSPLDSDVVSMVLSFVKEVWDEGVWLSVLEADNVRNLKATIMRAPLPGAESDTVC